MVNFLNEDVIFLGIVFMLFVVLIELIFFWIRINWFECKIFKLSYIFIIFFVVFWNKLCMGLIMDIFIGLK